MPRHLAVKVGYLPAPAHIPDSPLDDVNPTFNGSEGRTPVSPNAVPAGYPTPYTTGLRGVGIDPSTLTPHAGGITYSTAGAVIEGLDFADSVLLNAPNITLRRCRITSSNFFPLEISVNASSGVLVEDCRIRAEGVNPNAAILTEGNGSTFRRLDVSGGGDSMKIGANNVTVESCYMVAGYMSIPLDTHNDVIQAGGGSNFTITGCSIIGRWREQTSACLFGTEFSNIVGLAMTGCYLSGGNFTFFIGESGGRTITGVVLTDNRFELNSWNPAGGAYKSVDVAGGITETGTQVLASP